MNISYFQKINNAYNSKSKQETDLYELNTHVNRHFADTIGYQVVKRNGEDFELLVIKDTDSITYRKKIKSRPGEPINLGDYIEWNDQIWLITLLDTDDKTYCSGYMYLCGIPLRWQDSNGNIIEKWGYAEDSTSNSDGVTSNNVITIGDNQYSIIIPTDEDTKKLKRDMRFAIDFDDADVPDIYKLTNRKVKLNNNEYFNRGGVMTVVLSFNAFNSDTDKRVSLPSGISAWICNYKEIDTTLQPGNNELYTLISGGYTLKCGYKKSWSVQFKDSNGNEVNDCDFKWNVISEFNLNQSIEDNKISLMTKDYSLVEKSFLLQVIIENEVIAESEITVVDGM